MAPLANPTTIMFTPVVILLLLGCAAAHPGWLEGPASSLVSDLALVYARSTGSPAELKAPPAADGAPSMWVVAMEAGALALFTAFLVRVLVASVCSRKVERQSKSIESFAAFVSAVAVFSIRRRDVVLRLVNPLGFELGSTWLVLLLAKIVALALLDALVVGLVQMCLRPEGLQFRKDRPKVTGLAALEFVDYFYLSINQGIEYVFMLNVIHFVLASPSSMVTSSPQDLGVLNTVVALYLLFVVDDLIYAPAHLLMHWAPLYPYVHKHHHRQIVPKRGYADAGNEHPLEQIIGLSIVWATMQIVGRLCGLHAITILVHFVLYAALALLNHTNMDISFRFLGFDYSVGAHEMHHRNPNCNMAQYWMGLDRLMGTWRPYTPTKAERAAGADKMQARTYASKTGKEE